MPRCLPRSSRISMALKQKLLDPAASVLLYGSTPPRQGTPEDQVAAAADKLVERTAALPLDGIVVYDIQDETGRTAQPRPFPFVGTMDPRSYAGLLARRSGRPTIVYKALGMMEEAGWRAWLAESRKTFDMGFVSIVGRPTSGVKYPMPLSRAIRILRPYDRPHGRRRSHRRAAHRRAQRVCAPAREERRGLRLLHLADRLPRAADAGPAAR